LFRLFGETDVSEIYFPASARARAQFLPAFKSANGKESNKNIVEKSRSDTCIKKRRGGEGKEKKKKEKRQGREKERRKREKGEETRGGGGRSGGFSNVSIFS
jgi:hypothetical protein